MKIMFPEKALRDAEKAVRRQIIQGAEGTPADSCFVRIAKDVVPVYMRRILEELNRDTPEGHLHAALDQIAAWIIAQRVAAIGDPQERAKLCAQLGSQIVVQACGIALANEDPENVAAGEMVQGGRQ